MNASKERPLWRLFKPYMPARTPQIAADRRLRSAGAAAFCMALVLAGCASDSKVFAPQESFASVSTYSRLFDASPTQTCEAARRALLSQGYIVGTESDTLVEGQKNFQPTGDSHLQMVIRVVCVPESADGSISLGFVTALQDNYTLRKTNSSASLGVGGVGSTTAAPIFTVVATTVTAAPATATTAQPLHKKAVHRTLKTRRMAG